MQTWEHPRIGLPRRWILGLRLLWAYYVLLEGIRTFYELMKAHRHQIKQRRIDSERRPRYIHSRWTFPSLWERKDGFQFVMLWVLQLSMAHPTLFCVDGNIKHAKSRKRGAVNVQERETKSAPSTPSVDAWTIWRHSRRCIGVACEQSWSRLRIRPRTSSIS